MNIQRTDRTQHYDNTPEREPEAPKSRATAAQRAAERMESWIDGASDMTFAFQAAPSAAGAPAPATCGFGTAGSVVACGTETVPGAALFVRGQGDADTVDANDVKQGAIGDCHLLGPAMAMLQSPQGRARMQKMIKEVQHDGKTTYEVSFRIPVDRTIRERVSGAPAYKDVKVEVGQDFAKGHVATGDAEGGKTEVWPLVLEAEYAKLQGGHHEINGGIGTVGLANLTGKNAVEKTLEDRVFGYSASNLKKDFAAHKPMLITFTCQGGNDRGAPAVPRFGAYGFHCYAVKDVFTKDGETFVQLKNPWGHSDPKPIPMRELEALTPRVSIGQLP